MIGHFEHNAFKMQGAEKLAWNFEVPRTLLEPILRDSLPEDVNVLIAASDKRWTFEIEEFELPFNGELDTRALTVREQVAELISSMSFTARVGLSEIQIQRAGKTPMRVDGLALTGAQTTDGFKAHANFDLATASAAESAKFIVELGPLNLWRHLFAGEEPRSPLAWEANVGVTALPLLALLSDMEIESEYFEILDGVFAGNLQVHDGLDSTARIGVTLANDSVRVSLTDLWADREHLVRSGESDLIVIELEGSKLGGLVAGHVPEGMRVALPDEGCRIVVERIELPRGVASTDAFDLSQLSARARLEAPSIGILLDGSKRVALSGVHATLALAPEKNPVIELQTGIEGSEQSNLTVEVLALRSLEEIMAAEDLNEMRFKLDATANSISSSLVDRLAKQDGLIVDVLGSELNLTCNSAAIGLTQGPLKLHMNSETATLDWTGTLEDGVMISSGEDQLEAKVGLSPLFNERIIGSLVPILVEAKKEPGAAPVFLTLSDCTLPLGGDVSQMNGKLRLDLGAIQYRVLPQLEEFIGQSARLKNSVIAPIDINIVNGIAEYENLAIEIGGKNYSFAGSIALATNTLDFETEIPLSNLGSRLDRNVKRLVDKGLLDANVAVPVSLGGTVKRPRVGFRDGFIESLTKDLLPNALDDILKGGLEKLLGKD